MGDDEAEMGVKGLFKGEQGSRRLPPPKIGPAELGGDEERP